ncbi:hypothetical protein BDR03DRAFT_955734 [Suillus americanus]|nr:hypothetical protein BDR03DRAFT_955734 [Suillus americanus]
MHRQGRLPAAPLNSNMKLSLVFSVLASVVVLTTAYPTQGAAGIAKRSSDVEKRDSEELGVNDSGYTFKNYRKRDEEKRDLEELVVDDSSHDFNHHKKRDMGKRDLDVDDYYDYDFKKSKRGEGKRDPEELDVNDNNYTFEKYTGYNYRGKRDSEELDVKDKDYYFSEY